MSRSKSYVGAGAYVEGAALIGFSIRGAEKAGA